MTEVDPAADPAESISKILAGLVCVVTGGTRGIGRHTAELLARQGAAVAVCSRSAEVARDTATRLSGDHAVPTYGAVADVADWRQVDAFGSQVERALGTADILVNNAAVLGPVGGIHTVDLREWADAVNVDLVGTAHAIARFAPGMVAKRNGRIVNLSGGGVGGPGIVSHLSAYTSSKAAVMALTETVAAELAPFGVLVNALAPGAVATGFMEPVLRAGPQVAGAALYEGTVRQRETPDSLTRFDELLLYLLAPGSDWLTGRVLSARWESPADLIGLGPPLPSSRYRLRRIDGVLFDELPRDR
jgi:NAD(P)-dependent dehydrogenase (short-subunit alcohol dehydrogenase family)